MATPSLDARLTVGQALRRIYRHLLRRTALLAILGACIAVLVVAVAGLENATGQVALVVIGTLISLALLPDEPHRLWNVNSKTMAETVPSEKLVEAGHQLAGALAIQSGDLVPMQTMKRLWSTNVDELQRVALDPVRVVEDLDYRIVVTPGPQGEILVESDIDSERYVPGAEEVFISLCSNLSALSYEFGSDNRGCLLREMVLRRPDETPADWVNRVSNYRVSISASGRPLRFLRVSHTGIGGEDSAVVRLIHEAGPIADGFCGVRINVAYENPDTGEFPIKFSSYYCVGSTKISFEIRDGAYRLEHNEFLSTSTRPIDARVSASPHAVKAFISTNDDAVLPPGSGVVFQWVRGIPQLLKRPDLAISEVPEGSPLPPGIDLPSERIATEDLSEPLVEVTGVSVLDAYETLGILEGRRMLVRSGVHERLVAANRHLPAGFTLMLLDGWRSAATQRRLIDFYTTDAVEKQYVADLSDSGMRAPHLTGGAVDLTLCWGGRPLALGTDFDSFDVTAHSNAFEGVDSVTRRLRRMLFAAMSTAGFVPYPYEWWHWSYGDDVWAATVGAPRAIYECIESE